MFKVQGLSCNIIFIHPNLVRLEQGTAIVSFILIINIVGIDVLTRKIYLFQTKVSTFLNLVHNS